MKNELPLVSVITPCYNYAHFLPETAESVLQQKYSPLEYIIVNDGSSDNTEEIAKQYCKQDSRVKYIKQENQGLPSARNTGISMAKGKYILPLDADDTISPDYARKAVDVLHKNLAFTELADKARVLCKDAFQYLRQAPAGYFDYIYVAPPQYLDLWAKALIIIDEHKLFQPDGQVIVQVHPRELHPVALTNLVQVQERRYGSTTLVFYGPNRVDQDEEPANAGND